MRKWYWLVALLVGLPLWSGCTLRTRVADFTALSTKVTKVEAQKGERVTASACLHTLLGFIVWGDALSMEEGVDKILFSRKNADFLVDGVLYQTSLPLMVYNRWCYKVEGNVGRLK